MKLEMFELSQINSVFIILDITNLSIQLSLVFRPLTKPFSCTDAPTDISITIEIIKQDMIIYEYIMHNNTVFHNHPCDTIRLSSIEISITL